MKSVRITLGFFAIMLSAFTTFAASFTDRLPAGTHVASLSDAGKPGTHTFAIDKTEAKRILAGDTSGLRRRVATTEEAPRIAPVFDGALFKVKADKVIAFVGNLHEFSSVVIGLVYPDGEEEVLGAIGVEMEGTWFIPLLTSELEPIFTLRGGFPDMKVQVFDPYTGLFTLTIGTDFYVSEPRGVNEVRVVGEDAVKIRVGQLRETDRLYVNFRLIPEESLRRKETVFVVGQYAPETGEPILYEGDNLVTLVMESGECFNYPYTFNPPGEEW